MKIVVSDIPDEGLEVDLAEPLEVEGGRFSGPVSASLSVRKTDREVIVSGMIRVSLERECGRCLKPFTGTLEVPVDVVYDPVDELSEERHELHDDEMDTGFYRDDVIDLRELLQEQVTLSLPMKPLCSEDCRGICPVCGTDLNIATCGCRTDKVDPRLAVLKKLLDRGKE